MVDLGVFIPIGNNGWLISTTSPQYKPTFDFELEVVQRAERHGFDFGLSMVKFHGFGGPSQFWDYNLEPFTLIAGLAARTERIKLFASTAVLTLPPAVAARMAVTIDSISHGRFGVNIVSGWQKAEYETMGLWPGDEIHFAHRYDYSAEYVTIMEDLWENGVSNFKGEFFKMNDCRLLPLPSNRIPIVAAGQSDAGIKFAAQYADYNFTMGVGINTPTAHAKTNSRLIEAAAKTGRDVKTYSLFMVITGETDEEAWAKWKLYNDGADREAISWMTGQALADKNSDASSTSNWISLPEGAVNLNMGTLVGSHSSVARMLDEAASVPGTGGIMLTFDDFLEGIDTFGEKVQPLMESRAHLNLATQGAV